MLAAQLRRIVAAAARQPAMGALAAACSDLTRQLPTLPPAPKVAARLRRALAAGWADQVLLLAEGVCMQLGSGQLPCSRLCAGCSRTVEVGCQPYALSWDLAMRIA